VIPTKIVCLVPVIAANREHICQRLLLSVPEAPLSESKAGSGTQQFQSFVAHLLRGTVRK